MPIAAVARRASVFRTKASLDCFFAASGALGSVGFGSAIDGARSHEGRGAREGRYACTKTGTAVLSRSPSALAEETFPKRRSRPW